MTKKWVIPVGFKRESEHRFLINTSRNDGYKAMALFRHARSLLSSIHGYEGKQHLDAGFKTCRDDGLVKCWLTGLPA